VPYGYAGPDSDGGAALLANAGVYNMDITTGTQGLGRSVTGAPSGDTWRLSLRREFTDRLDVFLDASQSRNDSVAEQGLAPHTFNNIPAGTPNNPFTTPINIK